MTALFPVKTDPDAASNAAHCSIPTTFGPGYEARSDARRARHYAETNDTRLLSNRTNSNKAVSRPTDADYVQHRLNEAGATLLALPNTGPSTRLRQGGLEWVRDVAEAYGAASVRIRPAVPSGAAIDHMDEALSWIPRIPADKYVLRRVVGARCLVSPLTGRHLYTWRRIGLALGADHKAIQRWHTQGINLIVSQLNTLA